jgi:hypothetical protein
LKSKSFFLLFSKKERFFACLEMNRVRESGSMLRGLISYKGNFCGCIARIWRDAGVMA